ncbi:MAG: tRNA (guanosine(37)-N1)-methyltransferase TrmD [Acidobacteriota bacterium]|nr:tRNA (guanosine(37)-N1)-methyltransferase TrmD [Acidobacteriota bacterium]
MRFDIVTIFPEFFHGPFEFGVVPRALRNGRAEAHIHDLRAFTHDRHRTVDDRPFGGGEGMVLKPEPIFDAVESLDVPAKGSRNTAEQRVILLSAQGARFTQAKARELATLSRVVLICGRYEGVDERVAQLLCDEELSIGDYVLSGGELAAAVIVDAVVRLLPGVLGHADSSRYESFGEGDDDLNICHPERLLNCHPEHLLNCHPERSEGPASSPQRHGVPRSTHPSGGLLDYPHYTRPAEFRGVAIPEVLGHGDHSEIRRWRRNAALAKTLANRPDLLEAADLSEKDRDFLAALGPDLSR